jgi:Spy/CpxP family protein refolding chaperone
MTTFRKTMLALGAVALMAAPAWAQGQGRGGFGGVGGAMLLSNKGVQKELKVSDEQAKKLDTLATETREKNRERFAGLQDATPAERQSKMREAQAELHKGLADVLKPEQVKRFRQIEVQVAGSNAFGQPRVQEALKLTDDQKSKIREINQETMEATRDAFQNAGDDRAAAMEKVQGLRKEANTKAHALLTEDQKKEWKELTGEPFEFKPEPGQGGPGGRRPNN